MGDGLKRAIAAAKATRGKAPIVHANDLGWPLCGAKGGLVFDTLKPPQRVTCKTCKKMLAKKP